MPALYDLTTTGGANRVNIIFTDAASQTEYLDAFATQYGYQATIPNPNAGQPNQQPTIPNPVTKKDFFVDRLTDWMNDTFQAGVVNVAASAAADTARNNAKDKLRPKPAGRLR